MLFTGGWMLEVIQPLKAPAYSKRFLLEIERSIGHLRLWLMAVEVLV